MQSMEHLYRGSLAFNVKIKKVDGIEVELFQLHCSVNTMLDI